MSRIAVTLLLAVFAAAADEVDDMAARIEALATKEPLLPRADTLRRAAKMLESSRPELSAHFRALASCISSGDAPRRFPLPELAGAALERLVQDVEHAGDDPAAYDALAAVIRAKQLSAGLDNPSIRARIALADLSELLDPILAGLDGVEVRLSRYRTKPVMLAFWATWCVPCRAELSKLETMTSADLFVLAVSGEPLETVTEFLRQHPYHLSIFIDAGHKLSDRFHVDTLPAAIRLEPLH